MGQRRFTPPARSSEGGASQTAVRPRYRHPVRLAFGKRYYTLRRRISWLTAGDRWARVRPASLPVVQTSHATPLVRALVGNDDERMQRGKVTNLRLACARLDGVTLELGETFSYWRLIGATTARKGYAPGMVLSFGTVTSGVGGGLCQLSNLVYWMTLHTPLTVTERHRHSYDVFPDANRTQPFGSGATCFYNYGDLMIRNDTDRPFQLHVWLTDEELCGQWLSDAPASHVYEVYEAEHIMRQEVWGGYSRHNLLYRRVRTPEGVDLGDEYVTENHALMMYNPILPGRTDG
ncbi:MAG: VanW family protein [Micrococcales bacterium]|nr:VanW family protein [Micrococcales bacterium]